MCNSHAIRANVNKASKQAKRRECLPCERHSTLHILLHRFRKVNQNPQNVSSESPSKCSFLKSSTLPGGFMKNILLVSPIWTWICITMLTHADYKNRIRSHEKPENLDSTWSKTCSAPKTLSISRQRLIDNVSLAKTDVRIKCETTRRIRCASRMVEIQ